MRGFFAPPFKGELLMLDGRKMLKKSYENIKVYIDRELNELNLDKFLADEIKYHQLEYNQKPKKIYILHHIKLLSQEFKDFKTTKNKMLLIK